MGFMMSEWTTGGTSPVLVDTLKVNNEDSQEVSNAKERSQALQQGIQTGSGPADSDHRQKRGGSSPRIGNAGAPSV